MDKSKLVFIDTETTGLHPIHHEIWEVGLIWYEGDHWNRWQSFVRPERLHTAESIALEIGRFEERYNGNQALGLGTVLNTIADLTQGKHLVGAIPSFDEERLRHAGYRLDINFEWHYHVIDIEAMVLGFLMAKSLTKPEFPLPWKSRDTSFCLMGQEQPEESCHTALGDAWWVLKQFGVIMQWEEIMDPDFGLEWLK